MSDRHSAMSPKAHRRRFPAPTRTASRRLRAVLLLAALLGASVVLSGGCITPPAIPSAGLPTLDVLDFPPGAELVALPAGDERVLRGVFVPAGPGAPVVVLLPGAGESITPGLRVDMRLRTSLPSEQTTIRETSTGGMTVTTTARIDPAAKPLIEADATLGIPPDVLHQRVGFQGLAIDLADELGDGELRLDWRVLDELSALGLACLCVDTGGVGASSGERDSDRLTDDAAIVFDEALRRAGGDPARVALRGHSLGTLAAVSLLARGPAGVVLVAPVRGETVVEHFATWTERPWWVWLALPFLSDVTDVNLLGALRSSDVSTWVYRPEHDALLDDDERRMLDAACDGPRDRVVSLGAGHEHAVLLARSLLPGEADFYRALFPDRPPVESLVAEALATPGAERTALADPASAARARLRGLAAAGRLPGGALAAALALDERALERRAELLPWLVTLRADRISGLPLDAAQALLDLDDAGGPLPAEVLAAHGALLAGIDAAELPALAAEVLRGWNGADGLEGSVHIDRPEAVVRRSASVDHPGFELHFGEAGVVVDHPERVSTALLGIQRQRESASGAADPTAGPTTGRRALRTLLKSAGVPDRVAADGALLAWLGDAWRPFPGDD